MRKSTLIVWCITLLLASCINRWIIQLKSPKSQQHVICYHSTENYDVILDHEDLERAHLLPDSIWAYIDSLWALQDTIFLNEIVHRSTWTNEGRTNTKVLSWPIRQTINKLLNFGTARVFERTNSAYVEHVIRLREGTRKNVLNHNYYNTENDQYIFGHTIYVNPNRPYVPF